MIGVHTRYLGGNIQPIQREVPQRHGAVVHAGSEVLYQGRATVSAAQQVCVPLCVLCGLLQHHWHTPLCVLCGLLQRRWHTRMWDGAMQLHTPPFLCIYSSVGILNHVFGVITLQCSSDSSKKKRERERESVCVCV